METILMGGILMDIPMRDTIMGTIMDTNMITTMDMNKKNIKNLIKTIITITKVILTKTTIILLKTLPRNSLIMFPQIIFLPNTIMKTKSLLLQQTNLTILSWRLKKINQTYLT